ncbi:hypothetical protein HMPREF3227_00183 [Corynebacterium sp. CMW7794]|nr:hypothetical protein HMPREF0307_01523 [Corynebacterium sp. DNF00584]KXI19808.1 hypothetical protein HMPREF3227_00183 [Corynebacterium sp. CMW7794]OFP18944.1 hypothetical protein HMPREF2998_11080 [Corynebacterium sp. HMSC065A05]
MECACASRGNGVADFTTTKAQISVVYGAFVVLKSAARRAPDGRSADSVVTDTVRMGTRKNPPPGGPAAE